MSENYIVINGKRTELTREQLEQLGIKEEGNKRWRAKKGKCYWSINLSVSKYGYDETYDCDVYSTIDNALYDAHNYFQTKAEAQRYSDVLNIEMKLRKYADEHNGEFNNGYRILYCFISAENKSEIGYIWKEDHEFVPRCIKFSGVDVIDGAIEEIGKDKVIEYLTYEW